MNENLIRMSNEWVNEAKNDLRNKIISYIRETNISYTDLSDALAISRDELEQIIRGNCEISLLTFAKILIATNNVIEIKPLSATPFAHGFDSIPKPSEFVDLEEDEDMSYHGEIPMPDYLKPRREYGTTISNNPQNHREKPRPFATRKAVMENNTRVNPNQQRECKRVKINLDALSKHELTNIILGNHWEREIDINSSSRGDLINFLDFKERMFNDETPMPQHNTENKQSNDVERIKKFLLDEVERNPHLRQVVDKYMNSNR